MKNKSLIAVLAIVSCVAIMPTLSLYGQEVSTMIGGELTPDISWHIDNGTLHIRGKGVVPSTMFGARSAWNDHRKLFHSVVIEDGITAVGKNVFVGYKNITSLTIAGSVKEIDISAFNSCPNLSVVEAKGATPPDIALATFYKLKFKKARLIVPAGTKATYEDDALWNRFSKIEESAQPAFAQPAPAKTLAQPCTINLRRPSNFIGGGVSIRVFLNGVEQEKLKNASTVVMTTDLDKNVLYLQQGKKTPVAARRFDATAGGEIRIEYSHINGAMKILDENSE